MDSDWLLVWNTITFLLALWAMSDAEKAKKKARELEEKVKQLAARIPEPAKAK
jgi:hypothetical protein